MAGAGPNGNKPDLLARSAYDQVQVVIFVTGVERGHASQTVHAPPVILVRLL